MAPSEPALGRVPSHRFRGLASIGSLCGIPCGPTETRPEYLLRLKPNAVWAYVLDLLAALAVFVDHILTLDTLLSTTMAIASVLVCYHYGLVLTMAMNFGILSVGVIFPLSLSISQAFARREAALRSLVQFRCFAVCIFSAHRLWDWDGGNGRRLHVPPEHVAGVRQLLQSLFSAICTYCLLPRGGHARYYYTACGVREAKELQTALDRQIRRVERAVGRLALANEAFKVAGLPSGEASRVSQYVQKMLEQWELLRAIKEYRTPNAMRAFARVYILVLPVLFAPYFVHIALETSDTWAGGAGEGSRVAFACGIAATVSVMLAGLFSVELSMENPFSPSLDAVRVQHELTQAAEALDRIDADASKEGAWLEPLDSDDEGQSARASQRAIRRTVIEPKRLPSVSTTSSDGI